MTNSIWRKVTAIRWAKRGISGLVIFTCFACALPNQKDTAILVGAHYAFKLADTPEAQKVGSLLRKKANEILDEQLKENK